MTVEVRFFGSLKDAVGAERLELPVAATVDALLEELRCRLPATALAALAAENVRIARNHELVQGSVPLEDGDEVAFLPPVTGG